MIFQEGNQLEFKDPIIECHNYLMESFNIQRELRINYTNSAITIRNAKINGLLNENAEAKINIEMNDEAFDKLINIIKRLGNFLGKLFNDFIALLKRLILRDNALLLKANEDMYDAIHVDTLEKLKYTWREPSKKLLSFIKGDGNTESADIALIWEEAFKYTSMATNSIPFEQPGGVIQNMMNILLGNGGTTNIANFQREYANSLLSSPKNESGLSYERKNLIKESMISKRVVIKLEASIKEQQKSIERFIRELDKKKSETKDISSLNKYNETVNALNNIAVAVSNVIIDNIRVYEGQCRSVFMKIINYANHHKENE